MDVDPVHARELQPAAELHLTGILGVEGDRARLRAAADRLPAVRPIDDRHLVSALCRVHRGLHRATGGCVAIGHRRRRARAASPLGSIQTFAVPGATEHPAVVATTEACADRLPAASTASTPSVYDVPQASPENVVLVDPGRAGARAVPIQPIAGHTDVVARRRPRQADARRAHRPDRQPRRRRRRLRIHTGRASSRPPRPLPTGCPAASTASTPSVYDVPQASPENVALVDPVEPALEPFRYSP